MGVKVDFIFHIPNEIWVMKYGEVSSMALADPRRQEVGLCLIWYRERM